MKHSTFRYDEEAGIATITLDRPERLNALTFDVYAELRDLFAGLAHRESAKAIIITGAGRGIGSRDEPADDRGGTQGAGQAASCRA